MAKKKKRALGRGVGALIPKEGPDREFGNQMRTRRMQLQVTQAELQSRLEAQGLSMNPSTIARIESGVRPIRLSEALLVAEALETTLGNMIDIDESIFDKFERLQQNVSERQATFNGAVVDLIDAVLDVRALLAAWPIIQVIDDGVDEEEGEAPAEKYLRILAESAASGPFHAPFSISQQEYYYLRQFLMNMIDQELTPPELEIDVNEEDDDGEHSEET